MPLTEEPVLKSVLIVRTSAMGDIVFASPIAAAIKRTHPGARVTWLVESGLEVLLSDEEAIDEIITWPRREWARLLRKRSYVELVRTVLAFRRELHGRGFDLALDLQGLLKSGLLTRLAGASCSVSLGGQEASGWLMNKVVPKGGIEGRISSEYRYLAEQLELQTGEFLPSLSVNSGACARIETRLKPLNIVPGRYIVIAPFTTRPQKHWVEAEWARTANLLAERLQLPCIMLGGAENQSSARRIASDSGAIVNMVGATTLDDARALIARSSLVIGVDTGLTHIGVALERPTVAIFGSTRPYLDPGHRRVRPIWLGLSCSPCRRRPVCDGRFDCMHAITAERVCDEAMQAMVSASAYGSQVSQAPATHALAQDKTQQAPLSPEGRGLKSESVLR